MADADWENENPYASPRSAERGPGPPDGDEECDLFLIEPWLRPRDWIDIALVLINGLSLVPVFGVLLAGPCLVVYWYFGPPSVLLVVAIAGTICIVCGILLHPAEMSLKVSHLLIDAGGIVFERRVGTPKSLTWKEIRALRPATRWEVFFWGWLWYRLWSSREPTKTMSACGHYRIEWSDGFVFFPPKDPGLFETAIRRFGAGLLESGGHSSDASE